MSATEASESRPKIHKTGLSLVANGGDVPTLDIVFVHGLNGHPEKTWTYNEDVTVVKTGRDGTKRRWLIFWGGKKDQSIASSQVGNTAPTSSCFWPADLLPHDFPSARIFTYGYDSSISHFFGGAANRNNISDHGRGLLQAIASVRDNCRGRHLIFITHSLGGLVVKSALRFSSLANDDDTDMRDVVKSTIAILFFGTPHRGSDWADTGKILSKFASAMGFSTSSYNLDLLSRNNEMLPLLRDDFVRLLELEPFYITSFQESLGYKGVRGLDSWIVDPDSSGLDHRKERKIPIQSNHMEMCKFSLEGDKRQEYEQKVVPEVQRHIRRVDGIVKKKTHRLQESSVAFNHMAIPPDFDERLTKAVVNGYLPNVENILGIISERDDIARMYSKEVGDALVAAVEHQHYEIVGYLLKKGANANYAVRGGHILGIAIETDNSDIIALLLREGAETARNTGSFNARAIKDRSIVDRVKKWGVFSFGTATTPPRLAVGINALDVECVDNLRVSAYTKSVDTHNIFSVTLESWFTTGLRYASCCWMEAATDDSDYQFGTFNTMDDHPWTNPQPQTSRKITFNPAYPAPPKVVLWLNSLDTSSGGGYRVRLYATEVTEFGFSIHIDTWDNSEISSCGATWIAHSANKPNVASGIFRTFSSTNSSGHVNFDRSLFKDPSHVLLGISELDFSPSNRLRISLKSSEVTKERLKWQIDTDDNVRSATASYIALAP